MAQTFGNPYQPATAIGSGLQNIAIGLFGGRRGSTRDPALDAAHGALYDEQAKAKAVERQLNERLLADQSEDAQNELIGAHTGLSSHSVKAYRRELQTGGPNLHEYAPYADKLADAMIAIRGGYADKSINPANISKALLELKQLRDRNAIIAGANPANTSRAYLATEAKPLFGTLPGAAGSLDLSSGVTALNEIGTEKVKTETDHAGAFRGQEAHHRASAGNQASQQRQHDLENKAGVKMGAPVVVNDPEAGLIYTSPLSAAGGGRTPGARPTAPRPQFRAVLNDDGTTTYEPLVEGAHQVVGAPPRAATPRAPRKVTPNDRKMIESSIGEAMIEMGIDGGDLDPATRTAILKQAEVEFAGGAAGHQNAVQDAINKVAPEGFEQQGIYGFRRQTAKGGPRAVEKPVPGATPGAAPRQGPAVNATPGGAATGVGRAAAPAAAPAPAAAAPAPAPAAAPAKVARPQGVSDGQLIEEANKAIAGGKDPAAVRARLQAMGVKFSDKAEK